MTRRPLLVLATIALAAGLAGPATPASAATADWRRVAAPGGIHPLARLFSVTATTGTTAWAAGEESAGSAPAVPLLLTMTGSTWRKVPIGSVVPWAAGSFAQIRAVGGNNIWLVGYQYPSADLSTAVPHLLHYDGHGWTDVPTPGLETGRQLTLAAVKGRAPWLLEYASATAPTALLHWTGAAWKQIAVPPALASGELNVAPDGTAWLLWNDGSALHASTWNGHAWVQPAAAGPDVDPRSLLVGPGGQLWVSGSVPVAFPTFEPGATRILHWDGTAWTAQPVPGDEEGAPILTGDDAGNPQWGTGSGILDQSTRAFDTDYLQYTGGSWVRQPHPAPVGAEIDPPQIQDVAHLPGSTTTIAVGWAPYFDVNSQYVPRIERTDVP